MRVFHQTRLLKEKESSLLAAPPPPYSPNQSRKLGGTARGGGGSSGMCRVSSTQTLQPSWLETSLTRSQTNTLTHTHTLTLTDRLYEGVKGHSHPAGCSLSVLLSVLSRTPLAFNAARRYDIYKHSPQFSQSFLRALKESPRPHLHHHHHFCSVSLTHCGAFGGNLEEMSSTFASHKKEKCSPSNQWSLTHAPRRLRVSLLSFLGFLHPVLLIDLIYGFC